MDEVYPPENYGSSIHFPLTRYFEEFRNIFSSEIPSPIENNEENELSYLSAIKDLMDVNLDFKSMKQLSESCNVNLLSCEGENITKFPIKLPNAIYSNSKLPHPIFISKPTNTLEVNKSRNSLRLKEAEDQFSLRNKRNYHDRIKFKIPPTLPDLQPGSDFIISVLIYRPFSLKYFTLKNASEKLRFNHEIVVTGRNTLAQLRDAIICNSDEGLCKEVQTTSDDLTELYNAKDAYPSGFIFIDNVFYNDLRAPNSIDYSITLLEWAKERKIKNLKSTTIEGVRIDCLTPRFGYPYLYMHQGDCEHLLVFSDARLLNHDDCLHSESYPHVLRKKRPSNKLCFLCTVTLAKWICIGSERSPQRKMFLCTDCCNSYHYKNGKKIGNFKLYPYHQKPINS